MLLNKRLCVVGNYGDFNILNKWLECYLTIPIYGVIQFTLTTVKDANCSITKPKLLNIIIDNVIPINMSMNIDSLTISDIRI